MKRSPPFGQALKDGAAAFRQIRIGGTFTPGVMWILGVYTLTCLLSKLPVVGDFIHDQLQLRPALALGTRPYQLLAAPVLMDSVLSLIFLGVLLWSIGSAVEQKLGTRRFLWWSGLASLASAIMAALVGRLIPGQGLLPVALDGGAVFQLTLMAFAHFYGDVRVTMWGIGQPVSGRGLSYFFVGLGLAADLLGKRWPHLAASVTAVLCTLLLCRGSLGLSAYFRRLLRRKRTPGGFQVIDGGRAGSRGPSSHPRSGNGPQRWVN